MCDIPAPNVVNISLKVLSDETREFFFWTLCPVMAIAVLLNIVAILSIGNRKSKFLQKTCMFSLAISDLLYAIFIGAQYVQTVSQELMIWSLGKFMCSFLPMMHIFLTTMSSISLVIIALDRYQSVVFVLGTRWDPQPLTCLSGLIIITIFSAGISYPMANYFENRHMNVFFINVDNKKNYPILISKECLSTCITLNPDKLTVYYVTVFVLIFLPIFSIFFWFYYKIAAMIWKHRKPIQLRFTKWQNKVDAEEGSTSTTKTTGISNTYRKAPPMEPKKKNVQVKKKIRTFRIVVTLMIVFICFRAPYWILYLFRLCGKFKGDTIWNTKLTFITMSLLNCSLNPLLYTFLKQTIDIVKIIKDSFCKICNWCFSNDEFEDFGKENPFIVTNFQLRDDCYIKEPMIKARVQRY